MRRESPPPICHNSPRKSDMARQQLQLEASTLTVKERKLIPEGGRWGVGHIVKDLQGVLLMGEAEFLPPHFLQPFWNPPSMLVTVPGNFSAPYSMPSLAVPQPTSLQDKGPFGRFTL